MSLKTERLSSEIIKELSYSLLTESRDQLFKSVTITHADVTNDLSFAKIYFTTLDDDKREIITRELNNASSYFRTLLAEKINVRHMPKLSFVYDESIEYGNKIEKIIEEINDKN